jgi:hypothetical protein
VSVFIIKSDACGLPSNPVLTTFVRTKVVQKSLPTKNNPSKSLLEKYIYSDRQLYMTSNTSLLAHIKQHEFGASLWLVSSTITQKLQVTVSETGPRLNLFPKRLLLTSF